MRTKTVVTGITLLLTMLFFLAAGPNVMGKTNKTTSVTAKNISKNLTQKIDINSADQDTLIQVKGIGEKTAQSIIDYREKNGAFKDVEELMNIKGIGEKKLKKLKKYLTAS